MSENRSRRDTMELSEREWRRIHVEASNRRAGRCPLCPPHRGENRTNRKRNAGQKPRARRKS